MKLSFFTPAPLPDRDETAVDTGELARLAQSDPVLEEIAARAAALCGVPSGAVSILDCEVQHLVTPLKNAAGAPTPRAISFCGHAVADPDRVLCVPDATLDPRFAGNPFVTGSLGLRFYAGMPVFAGGDAVGAVCAFGPAPREYITGDQADALRALALEAGTRLDALLETRGAPPQG